PQSETIVSVSGQLESVFDLRSPKFLQPFVELVKDFTLSKELLSDAKRLASPLRIARTADELLNILLAPDWRVNPMQLDVPAPSQIFGQIAAASGIEGILYSSKFTGSDCLAIFPSNLVASTSYLQLDDATPHPRVPTRVDSSNWQLCELTPDAIIRAP
ncbi:MAG: RES family NAD+ phosphorylase, partial [Polyangiaceae bacterium]